MWMYRKDLLSLRMKNIKKKKNAILPILTRNSATQNHVYLPSYLVIDALSNRSTWNLRNGIMPFMYNTQISYQNSLDTVSPTYNGIIDSTMDISIPYMNR